MTYYFSYEYVARIKNARRIIFAVGGAFIDLSCGRLPKIYGKNKCENHLFQFHICKVDSHNVP